jgi:enoyl-CoA hydratase/carnithine racemase
VSGGRGDGGVTLGVDGAVATLVLDRERKRNALTPAMLDDLDRHCATLEEAEAVRVVLLRGAGPAFSAGADLTEFAAQSPAQVARRWTSRVLRVLERFADLPQVTVAVVHGAAFGGGLELVLAADVSVVARGARLGLSETGIGTTPGWGGSQRLVRAVGPVRARDVILTGRVLDADTAHAWGLVSRVSSPEGLETEVAAVVDAVRARAPLALALAKRLIEAAADGVRATVSEPLAGAVTAATADLAEGVAAFRERRPASFTGS